MGMFDNVVFIGESALQVKCAAGHVLRNLQTKSLDCDMTTYYVVNGRIYGHAKPQPARTTFVDGDALIIAHDERATFESVSDEIEVHNACTECDPVLYVRGACEPSRVSWGDGVSEREPGVAAHLIFRDGVLVEVRPVEMETRDEIKEQLAADGLRVLRDDETIAQAHFERRRHGRARRA